MSLSTPYHTILSFTHDENIKKALSDLINSTDYLGQEIKIFTNQVSKFTRRENRHYLNYMIGCIEDDLSEHPKQLKTSEQIDLSSATASYKFQEIMATTRSKELYKSGLKLKQLLIDYSNNYNKLKEAIAQSEL